jgi:uncharacterized Rmd1/YagE family protein
MKQNDNWKNKKKSKDHTKKQEIVRESIDYTKMPDKEVRVPAKKKYTNAHTLNNMQRYGEDKVIAQKIYIMSSKGYHYKDIRKELKIKHSLWDRMMYREKDEFPIYWKALKQGERLGLEEVENSLRSRAIGYDFTEIHDDEFKGIKKITKHIPADVKAAMYYLSHKDPEKWGKQAQEINVNHKNEQIIDYENMPPEMIDELLKYLPVVGEVIEHEEN